ncbi:tetratricopeptide repeat protein [Mycolicibacterium gilvum]|uniref:Conserved Mce associated membrane protein n=1 Tax=Mycolicibacterium gilvum TaxID=1804 RepID=A0A378SR78_9MYCO|nr:tetratricopeptide repeat protein [Mycolicibacterium gilvum]MCV7058514.1 tetratricopeptide repeat protein [Mycolicibacterium gilvum]STZ45101.1 conserved Mce associated membrane protein [Mycolicibacterium gilvum]
MADDAAAPEGELTDADERESSTAVELTDTDSDADADTEGAGTTEPDDTATTTAKAGRSPVKLALIAGLVAVLALAGLAGWLGYQTYESHRAEERRNLFVQVGRQGALNLTTINWESAEADVQRILDSATGTFYDDFQQRAEPFVQVVKQAQSKSEGSIAEAGLESATDTGGQVLVAVTVRTTNAGSAEQQPRAWRMRISVQEIDGEAKVSNVEFVP